MPTPMPAHAHTHTLPPLFTASEDGQIFMFEMLGDGTASRERSSRKDADGGADTSDTVLVSKAELLERVAISEEIEQRAKEQQMQNEYQAHLREQAFQVCPHAHTPACPHARMPTCSPPGPPPHAHPHAPRTTAHPGAHTHAHAYTHPRPRPPASAHPSLASLF